MAKRSYKPTQIRVLEGGRSHSLTKPEKALASEPKPRPVIPECPKDIDTRAKKVFKRLAPQLASLKLLTELDGDMFGCLCQIRARLDALHRYLKSKNCKEAAKANPWDLNTVMRAERQYYALFRMYAREFGMSPCGRVGLSVGINDPDEGDNLLP